MTNATKDRLSSKPSCRCFQTILRIRSPPAFWNRNTEFIRAPFSCMRKAACASSVAGFSSSEQQKTRMRRWSSRRSKDESSQAHSGFSPEASCQRGPDRLFRFKDSDRPNIRDLRRSPVVVHRGGARRLLDGPGSQRVALGYIGASAWNQDAVPGSDPVLLDRHVL